MHQTRIARLSLLLTFLCVRSGFAHFCGPTDIELQVGETLTWRITADMTEEETVYTPTLTGPANVVRVFPDHEFRSRHGVFVFTGVTPGTNVLSVHWLYEGNGANATCPVTIRVIDGPTPLRYSTAPGEGSLVANDHSVPADTLRGMIDRFIPTQSEKLFVFTQCFGGNIIISPSFADAPNLCILSATVANQTGKYGGYHDDAARGLKPETGRTAKTLHSESVQGKMTAVPAPGTTNTFAFHFRNSEWPLTGGTMAPEAFSLEPITPTSQIQSRHIVIFMGQPETKNIRVQTFGTITVPSYFGTVRPISDNADRDAIIQQFAGQPNTTIVTVGGDGQNGWQKPGRSIELSRALRAAGDAIAASENPAREQFILFVGDHGGTGYLPTGSQVAAAAGSSVMFPNPLNVIPRSDELHKLMTQDPNSTPMLRVNVEPGGQPQTQGLGFPPFSSFPSDSFTATLTAGDGSSKTLTSFQQITFDWDEDGLIEPGDGEYASVSFPINEGELLGRFSGKSVDITFSNNSTTSLLLTGVELYLGDAPRTDYVIPPPRILSAELSGDQILLTVEALQSLRYAVDVSTDLNIWTGIVTNQPFTETFVLPVPQSGPSASYRLRWVE